MSDERGGALRNILIVAGEASGDHHASELVSCVKASHPEIRFAGIGGEHMQRAGVEIYVDAAVMAVVGIVEVLAHYPTLHGALQKMRRALAEERPDLLILVDYPDFNLRLARTAKELGIKVLYFISPQVWAWRQKRVYQIKRLVDMMAVIFPFEVPFYEEAGVPVRYVGHPLLDKVVCNLDQQQARERLAVANDIPVIGLFPGSRRSELKRLLPLMVTSAEQLYRQHPTIRFLLPRASTLSHEDLNQYLIGHTLPIEIIDDDLYTTIRACDGIVSASGTATLEVALMGTPLVVIYRIAPLSYQIISRLVKVDHIAMCNIVAGEEVAPELIQDQATSEAITREMTLLIDSSDAQLSARQRLSQVRERLGEGGTTGRIANLTLEMVELR